MSEPFSDPQELEEFILGGKAVLTVKSLESGQHFTFRIKHPKGEKDHDGVRFVELLGSDSKFRYLANINLERQFVPTRKTLPIMVNHPAMLAFKYVWGWLHERKRMPPQVEAYHEGKCSICGIKLTHPESVRSGIGPECRKKRRRR